MGGLFFLVAELTSLTAFSCAAAAAGPAGQDDPLSTAGANKRQ